jgi:hypothetical protein
MIDIKDKKFKIEAELKAALAAWNDQKLLISRGIIDRDTIYAAMDRLNIIHSACLKEGFRDLLDEKSFLNRNVKRINMLWD